MPEAVKDVSLALSQLPSVDELNRMQELVEKLYGSAFIPQSLIPKRGIPGEVFDAPAVKRITCANAIGAMVKGREMGLQPIESLGAVWASPDGSLRMYARTMLSLMFKHGFQIKWEHIGPDYAELTVRRPGQTDPVTRRWSIEDSQRFFGGSVKADSNWAKDPEDMNVARATSRVFNSAAADIVGAPVYDPRELGEDAPGYGKTVETTTVDEADFTIGRLQAAPSAGQGTPVVAENGHKTEPPAVALEVEALKEGLAQWWTDPLTLKAAERCLQIKGMSVEDFVEWLTLTGANRLDAIDACSFLSLAAVSKDAYHILTIKRTQPLIDVIGKLFTYFGGPEKIKTADSKTVIEAMKKLAMPEDF